MLNKRTGLRAHILSRAIPVALGATILFLSSQMLLFGWNWRDIDMSETGNDIAHSSRLHSESLKQWSDVLGYRLMSRKIETTILLQRGIGMVSIDEVRRSALRVLQISPLEPGYWILLGRISQLNFSPEDESVNHLRMSYLSGRSDFTVMPARLNLALSLWPNLTESDKQIAVNDLTFGPFADQDAFEDIFKGAPNGTLQEIRAILDERSDDMLVKVDKLIQDRQ